MEPVLQVESSPLDLFIYSVPARELITQAPFPINGEKTGVEGLDSATVFWMKDVLQRTFHLHWL